MGQSMSQYYNLPKQLKIPSLMVEPLLKSLLQKMPGTWVMKQSNFMVYPSCLVYIFPFLCLGGMGLMRDCGLERVLRDLRIFRIFEGANDIMRIFVALTGMQYAGKHLEQLSKNMKSGSVTAIFGEVKRRAFSELGGDISSAVDPSFKDSAASLNGVIEKFGASVQSLLSHHGRGIADRQHELIRVANAAIDIYSMVAVLSRASYAIANDVDGSV